MKLFKSKKKDGEKKTLFGKSKKNGGSKKELIEQQQQSPADAGSSSSNSHTDTATTAMSPQWLNSNNNGAVNSRSSALSYHEQVLGGGDRSFSDPVDELDCQKNSTTASSPRPQNTNPFGEDDANLDSASISSSDSEGGDMDDRESPSSVLIPILEYLEEKERREWADGVNNDSAKPKDKVAEKEELDDMLRKTVDHMDVNTNDLKSQRLGARIVYLVSNIRNQDANNTDSNQNEESAENWYANEKPTAKVSNNAAFYDEDDEELMIDALDAVLQAMEDFPDNEALIENSCSALEATSENNIVQVNAKRILEEVLMAIEGFADNRFVVSSSMGILYNLSSPRNATDGKEDSNGELRRKLAKYALPSILQGMKEHRDDVELYTKGCKAMANFTRDDPNAQRILVKEPLGLRVISEGMKYWEVDKPDEYAVLQHLQLRLAAIRVLKNLSTHISLEVKGKIALGGGAARIVDRLLEALVFTGKDLIANNYQVGELNTNTEGDDQVDEEDEVGLCLTIMRDALETIGNLANIESVIKEDHRSPHMPTIHRSAAVDNSSAETIQRQLTKAVKPVVNIIRQHPNRPSLQYHALTCVKQLSISHADAIADQGGISTFLNLLSSSGVASVNESIIHERALSCLTGLLSPSSNADGLDLVASMETEDGLNTIFRTIRRYQSNTGVIETAYETLFYLSCRVRVVLASVEGRHHRIANGVGANSARRLESHLCLEENIFVMLGTLNQYFEASESISQRGLGLLVNVHAFLTRTQEQQQHREPDILVSDGGIRLILAVMRRHGLAVAIQEYGVGLLAGILRTAISHDSIRREFVDEEGISTVLAAMMIHPDHAAIQSHGCDVLIQLMAIDKHPMENGYSETAAYSAYYKKVILEETHAVSVVQDSMQRFRSHKGVKHYGSILLEELSKATAVTPLSALPSKLTSKISSSFRS